MKSKISCFNTALFLKNITMYWPVWASCLVMMLCTIPGKIIYTLYEAKRWYPNGFTNYQSIVLLAKALDISWEIVLVFLAAIVTCMVLFSYLFQAKSANMIHAFPVTRGELYGTNVVTGLLFLLGPQLLSFFIGLFILLGYKVTCVEYFAQFVILLMGMTVLAYAMSVFCAMITGQIFALPVFYLAVNVLYIVVEYCIGFMVEYLGFGLVYNADFDWKNWFSPVVYLLDRVKFYASYRMDENGSVIDGIMCIAGEKLVLGYVGFAILLFVLAFLLYKNRNVECAGDLVAVPVLRPILRWSVGFCAGYVIALIILNIGSLLLYMSRTVVFIILMAAAVLFYIFAQMFISKTFKVFRSIRWWEFLAFIAVTACSFFVLLFCANRMERYVPKEEDIKSVAFEGGTRYTIEGEDMVNVRNWHQQLVNSADDFRSENYWDDYSTRFKIEYELMNGKKITRQYYLPIDERSAGLLEKAYEIEQKPELFVDSFLYGNEPDGMYFDECRIEYRLNNSYYDICLDEEQTHRMEKAVIRDIQAGTLQKYNIWYYEYMDGHSLHQEESKEGICNYLDFIKNYPKGQSESFDTQYYDTTGWNSYNQFYEDDYPKYQTIWFGPDCENVVRLLIEFEIIDSVDDLL